jgi:anti-sigma B factor antagonist
VDFTLSTRRGRTGTVLEVTGELDLSTSPQLTDRLQQLMQDGARRVVIDLAGVSFMDSTALGALVVAHRDLSEGGGRLSLAEVRRPVRKVLAITSVDRIIDIFDTVQDAEEAAMAQT